MNLSERPTGGSVEPCAAEPKLLCPNGGEYQCNSGIAWCVSKTEQREANKSGAVPYS